MALDQIDLDSFEDLNRRTNVKLEKIDNTLQVIDRALNNLDLRIKDLVIVLDAMYQLKKCDHIHGENSEHSMGIDKCKKCHVDNKTVAVRRKQEDE